MRRRADESVSETDRAVNVPAGNFFPRGVFRLIKRDESG